MPRIGYDRHMTTSSIIINPSISRWRAEFIDPQLERAYQAHVLPDTVRFLRFSLYLWAGLLIAAIPIDFGSLTSTEGIVVISGLRITHVILLLWLAWQLKRTPVWASSGWPVSIVTILGYPVFLVYPMYEPALGDVSRNALFLMMLSIYVFIPNRLVLTNAVALAGIAGATGVQILIGNSSGEVVFTFVFLCWPAMLGCVVAHRALVGSRRAYLLLRASEFANQSLEMEIARRKSLEAELQRQALEQESLCREGIELKVTATFALTQVLAEDTDIQECIRRADLALYQGKHAGRNRVAIADPA